jgi:hypothetical protein
MRKLTLAAALAAATISTTALATVTFDTNSGTGFVGKGDVQTAFGWANAKAQANQNGVTFVANATIEYDVTCLWDTVTGGKTPKTIHHSVTSTKSIASSVSVDSKNKTTGQYTGWFLNGHGLDDVSASLPIPGTTNAAACSQGGVPSDADPADNDAVVGDVVVTSQYGNLSAVFGGVPKVIYSF